MAKLAIPIFFILVVFGLVMLASAGVGRGDVVHQLGYGVIPGLAVFLLFSKIDYRRWRTFAFPLLLVAIVLLVAVFIPGIGQSFKGARRWIDIGFATVQPAEFFKFALIIYLAAWFARHRNSKELVPFFLVLAAAATLLLLQPDFGTLGIVLMISIALFFFSGATIKHFIVLMLVVAMLGGGLAVAAPYRFDRVKTFFNPHEDKQGTSYHINQALISIGSGGVWGLGYGQSKQKLQYLPEPTGDSIFAVIGEELGFAGAATLLLLFLLLVMALAAVAKHAPDPFARLFVLGVAAWIGGQAIVNIAAITGIIPLTGVPLPLISFGSSSLVSLMGAMGIVRNVSQA